MKQLQVQDQKNINQTATGTASDKHQWNNYSYSIRQTSIKPLQEQHQTNNSQTDTGTASDKLRQAQNQTNLLTLIWISTCNKLHSISWLLIWQYIAHSSHTKSALLKAFRTGLKVLYSRTHTSKQNSPVVSSVVFILLISTTNQSYIITRNITSVWLKCFLISPVPAKTYWWWVEKCMCLK